MPEQDADTKKKSTFGINALVAGMAIALTLLAGEVAVHFILPPALKISTRKPSRMQGMPRFVVDPEIGWIIEPGDESYHFQAPGRYGNTDAVYHLHQGTRDTPPSPASNPILVTTGCSFTFGFGLNDSETWPWLVGEKLPEYRVVNIATSAYGVNQSLMRTERFESQAPGKVKMILYGFADFHVDRDRAFQKDLLSLYPTGRPRTLLDGQGTRNNGLVYFWAPGKLLEHSSLFMHVLNHVADIANKTPNEEESSEISMRLLQQFAERCRAKKIAFGVVVLPHGSDHGPISSQITRFTLARLKKAGIPFLVPDFPRNADGNIDHRRFLISSDEFHPNRDYNILLSDQIAKFVQTDLVSGMSR